MASNNKNTLNDVVYSDANVSRAVAREQNLPPAVGTEYDHVLSVFTKVMKDASAAKNFTQSLYKVAQETGTYVLTILESLDVTNEITLNASMAYYLNSINSPSTLYGVQNPIRPNYYAGRNVLS